MSSIKQDSEKPHSVPVTNKRRGKNGSQVVRTRDGGKTTIKMTRAIAIKVFCMECLGWESNPSECTHKLCPLYLYRGRSNRTQYGDSDNKS